MSDDKTRLLTNTSLGTVQAWSADEGEVAIAVSLYADIAHETTRKSYTSHTLFLTASDAYVLADALTTAAQHATSVEVAKEGKE